MTRCCTPLLALLLVLAGAALEFELTRRRRARPP
jgi:hypothetical protein